MYCITDSVGITISLLNHRENDAFKQRINLAPFNRLNITVRDVPSDIWFIVLQIHTFQYNATLSYDKALLDKVSNRSLFGSNIGLYLKTYDITAPIQVFLKHENVYNLDVLLVIVTYGRNGKYIQIIYISILFLFEQHFFMELNLTPIHNTAH